jgi:sugar/nucleoside kinase (ribokinase family)
MLVDTANRTTEHPGYPALLADTIGAGDGFTAMMVLGYLRGASPEEISEILEQSLCVGCEPGWHHPLQRKVP